MSLAELLASMPHSELYQMRATQPNMQDIIAPYEHRAFAREWATQSPFLAGVSLPFAIPAYTASKYLGINKARSPASLEEMKQGYIGLGEGLAQAMRGF